MSTTSLSSYDYAEYCQCAFHDSFGRIYQAGGAAPFYNALGQPLVYYAQLEHQGNRSKRENRNCFVKAFKWYTQDLRVNDNRNENRAPPDLKDFAKWLDCKYSEYLSETEAQRSAPNSVREPTVENTSCSPHTTRRFSRMRSPWSKRKSSNRNEGEMNGKPKSPTASCQFILYPQDLNRPASACHQNPPTCPNKCYVSNEALEPRKGAVKSQSMTNICHESVIRNCIQVRTAQEGPTNVPIACPNQNNKVDKKLEPESKENKECIIEKYVCPPLLLVPCNEPPPCQNQCKTKPNFKLVQQPSRCQGTENRSYETFTEHQNTSVRDNTQNREHKLEMNLESDQTKESTLVHEIKSHARESVCDTNCRNRVKTEGQCKNFRENREVPVKSCVLETCEESSKLARELYLARKAQEGQRNIRVQKCANEQEDAFELETEQIPVTKQQMNTLCDSCTLTDDHYTMQIPEYQQSIKRPVQTRERASQISKKTKVDVECQCPDYQKIENETVSFEQTQNNPTMMLQRYQEQPKFISPVYKKKNEPKVNVSCQCSDLEVNIQIETSTQDKTPATSRVIYYTKDVLCQCSDDNIKQTKYPPQRPQKTKFIKAKENITDGTCECADRDVIQYDSSCQYRRNDCEPSVNTLCLCPKPVRRMTPVCNIRNTDSGSWCTTKNCVNLKRATDSATAFRNDDVQTSNHSINIEDAQNYALFMKIVCADKLK